MYIDTHCHFDDGDYETAEGFDERDVIIARAHKSGIKQMIVIGSGHGINEVRSAIGFTDRDPMFAAIGVHPHHASAFFSAPTPEGLWGDDLWQEVSTLARHKRVVAIGETGLDYHYNYSTPEQQREIFSRFIKLAQEVNKPLSLHIRDAHEEAQQLIHQAAETGPQVYGVVHCFTGTKQEAEKWINLGFILSFSGIVTFKNADSLREVCRWVPADRFVLETDAPYLAPVPFRGKRNEPAYLVNTAEYIANLRGVSVELLAAQTTATAKKLFSLP